MVKMYFKGSNDNGNSEQALKINGELFTQPNIYSIDRPKTVVEGDPSLFIPALLDNLYVTITSSAIERNGDYFIGKRAYNSDYAHSLTITKSEKHTSDLPIINTLGFLAGLAVKQRYEEKQVLPKSIELSVDMVTALPIKEYDATTAKAFEERFMNNTHEVMVHVGTTFVKVSITFEFVYALQEGACANYALILDNKGGWRNDDIFEELKWEYQLENFTGEDVFNMKMTCGTDIGEGTTDIGILKGYKQIDDLSDGDDLGVGYAITKALPVFKKAMRFPALTRHEYMEIVKDSDDAFHVEAVATLKDNSSDQATLIHKFVEQLVVHGARKQPRLISVFGGGSITLKDKLYNPLKAVADDCRGKILWIPEKYATTINVEGMDVFLNVLLPQLKEQYMAKKEKQKA